MLNRFRRNTASPVQRIRDLANRILEDPILTSFTVLLFLTLIVGSLSLPFYLTNGLYFFEQVLVEAHGMLFDILIIGIFLFWLNANGQKRQRIRGYIDEIDDFRSWRSEESTYRTVGNIKKLNRYKINKLDLANCYLHKANLNHIDLSGSNLNSADLSEASLNMARMVGTRFNTTSLRQAILNQANLQNAFLSGANLENALFIKANLNGAMLIEANLRNAVFMSADLQGANFNGAVIENTNFYKADLRDVRGLTWESLIKARTLHKAKLDPELLAQIQEHRPQLLTAGDI